MYLELDEDHMAELEAIVQDYGVGNMDYAPLEKFETVEIFVGEFSTEQLDRFKEIVQAALEDKDYSNSLMSEIIGRIEKSQALAGMREPDEDELEDDELEEGDESLLARVPPPTEAFRFLNRRRKS